VSVPGSKKGPAEYKVRAFGTAASGLCSADFKCTWNPNVANSWQRNLNADVLQGFYFDNAYHDYLLKAPFGFTPRAGNFSGDDPLLFHALDGANTDNGFPDGNHVDSANMTTPPDGVPPTMQMSLFHIPGAPDDLDPFLASSSAFDPSVILHEYTHGLSNRLVVDVSGNSTLNSMQAASMGEAWSDFYATDYLVTKGLERDTAAAGQLLIGKYLQAGVDTQLVRTMPIDCPVGTASAKCTRLPGVPGGPTTGGYTYGELADVIGRPEVHASGEVWGQTLWDLRNALGHRATASIVTRAMELSPDDPSFLDMRNAIVQADLAVYGGSHRVAIWKVFAHRGMGWFAGSLDGSDAFPDEDFSLPPTPETARGTVSGQVTDGIARAPIAGALVAIAGHDSGYTGSYSAITDASGRYTIDNVLAGIYPRISAFGPGYEILTDQVVVDADGASVDFAPRRDWAASSGGGAVVDSDGPDFSGFSCGPGAAIDLRQGTGWVTVTGTVEEPTDTIVPKSVVISLPEPITLTDLAIDPTATCGLDGSASAGDFTVESSPDGTEWTEVAAGTFDPDDSLFRYNDVPVEAPVDDVSFIRYTIESPQVDEFATTCPDGLFAGCTYMSTTEVEVFGSQAD
jgi:extracellular elastinolytic metalloproteinase